jgi:hypothetical protein
MPTIVDDEKPIKNYVTFFRLISYCNISPFLPHQVEVTVLFFKNEALV